MSLVERLREWAHGHTRRDVYSPVGQTFHWLMAFLVIFQIWWGWRIGRLPVGADKLEAYQLHSQSGVLLLVLILLRALWRLMIPGPVNDADKPGWQSTAAHITHYVLYFLMIALPISGWAMWSAMASEQPLAVAGALPWPQLPLGDLPSRTRWRIMEAAEIVHLLLVWSLLITLAAHVGASLKHHFIDRDDVLAAMVPFLKPLSGPRASGSTETQGRRSGVRPPGSPAA